MTTSLAALTSRRPHRNHSQPKTAEQQFGRLSQPSPERCWKDPATVIFDQPGHSFFGGALVVHGSSSSQGCWEACGLATTVAQINRAPSLWIDFFNGPVGESQVDGHRRSTGNDSNHASSVWSSERSRPANKLESLTKTLLGTASVGELCESEGFIIPQSQTQRLQIIRLAGALDA